MENSKIIVQTTINAPTEQVWASYTNPQDIMEWNTASPDWHTPKAENDLRVGGKFSSTMAAKDGSFSFDFWGIYDEIVDNQRIAYTMGDGRKATVDFKSEGNQTVVTTAFDPESENPRDMQQGGWQAILNNFKKYTESLSATPNNNKIYPCLWFDGQAKAAAELYCSIFPNSNVTVDTPMVVNFDLSGQKFMGLNGGPHFKTNASISFYVVCETEEEVLQYWQPLSEGGELMIPLDKYPWSEKYGWLKDRFGVTWQITLDKTAAKGQKIIPALLFTQKSHGRGSEAVDFYTSLFPNSTVTVKVPYEAGENTYATEGMVKFSQFNLNGQSFIIMDAGFPQPYTFNEGISLVVDCDGQDEVDYYWSKFTEGGGQESQCAWLKDKFGVSWQIVPSQLSTLLNDPDREKAGRAMQAMMQMKKIIIADLQKAYDK